MSAANVDHGSRSVKKSPSLSLRTQRGTRLDTSTMSDVSVYSPVSYETSRLTASTHSTLSKGKQSGMNRKLKVLLISASIVATLIGAAVLTWQLLRKPDPTIELGEAELDYAARGRQRPRPRAKPRPQNVVLSQSSFSKLKETDNLVIKRGSVVVFPETLETLTVKKVFVYGHLQCPNTTDFKLTFNFFSMVIDQGGSFTCGTQDNRFNGRLRMNVGFIEPDETISAITVKNGMLNLHGKQINSWGRMRFTAPKGARNIEVISETRFFPGDELVLAPTDFRFDGFEFVRVEKSKRHRTVNNRYALTLNTTLKYTHYGDVQTYRGLNLPRGEYGLLTRNIQIYGRNVTHGGATIKMAGLDAKAYVDSVEIRFGGTFDLMGRYPIHWHLCGDASGQYFVNSSITFSENRCLSLHNTHNVLVADNVCADHKGHGMILEDGREVGNQFLRNLVIGTRMASGKLIDSDKTSADSWATTASFWFMNPNNTFVDNVAAGVDGSGFLLELHRKVYTKQRNTPAEPYVLNETEYNGLRTMPLKEFRGNVAHSTASSAFWFGQEYDPIGGANITDLKAYKVNGNRGNMPACLWIFSATGLYVSNMICADFPRALWPLFKSTISDSVFVAFSDNIGDPEPQFSRTLPQVGFGGYIEGISAYDGPSSYIRIHLENFYDIPDAPGRPNSGVRARHLQILGGSFSSPKNMITSLTLKNPSQLVVGPPSNKDGRAQVEDVDGSLTRHIFGAPFPGATLLTPTLINGEWIMDPQRNDSTCVYYPPNLRHVIACKNLETVRVAMHVQNLQDGRHINMFNQKIRFGINGVPSRQRIIYGRSQTDFELSLVHGTVSSVEFLSFRPERFLFLLTGGTFGDRYQVVFTNLRVGSNITYTVNGGRRYDTVAAASAGSEPVTFHHDPNVGRLNLFIRLNSLDNHLTDEKGQHYNVGAGPGFNIVMSTR